MYQPAEGELGGNPFIDQNERGCVFIHPVWK